MSVDVIGRADYELGTDPSGLKRGLREADGLVKASGAELEETYKSAAYRAGEHIGNGIKTGVRIVGGAATVAFGLATKGVLELEDATASYRAETGATEEQARAAGKAINEMSGRNLQPVKEIGTTLEQVTKKFGQTGGAANATTQSFLTFARATKQGAAEAVADFDDILDGYGLTAEAVVGIQDQLVKSSQRYGGSVVEMQRALGAMAPQLKALNMTEQDGIAILNLFAASGLDAAKAQGALNAAIANLPPGTNLGDIVAELSAIEDPAIRAARASEVFGQRAGPALANALKPGMAGLDSFKVSASEAAGASQEAAAALDSSFGAQAQLKLKQFTSVLTGLGQEFGPVITGLSGLASLAGTVGLDRIAEKIGPGLVKALRAVGEKAGDAIGDGMNAVWQGATGTVIGNNIATRIEGVLGPENTYLTQKLKAASGKLAAVWAAGMAVAGKLADAVSSAFVKMPGMGAVRAAVLAASIQLGTMSGTALGTAFTVAAAAAIVAAPLIVLKVGISIREDLDRQTAELSEQTRQFAMQGTEEGIRQAREGIEAKKHSMNILGFIPIDAFGARARLDEQMAILDRELAARANQSQQAAHAGGLAIGDGLGKGAATGIAKNAGHISSSIAYAGPNWAEVAKEQGRRAGFAVAQGITEKRDAVDDAWMALKDAILHPMSVTKETAKLLGRLASGKLIEGLKSSDPAVRAQARATKQLILDRLEELKPRAGTLSKEAMDQLRRGMRSKDPDIRAASTAIYNAAIAGPKNLTVEKGKAWGSAIGRGLAAGLNAQAAAVGTAAGNLAGIIADYLETHSPAKAGPLSRSGGPEAWGARVGAAFGAGIASHLPDLSAALSPSVGAFGFAAAAGSLGSASSLMIGGTARIELNLTPAAAAALEKAGYDSTQVAGLLRDGVDASGLLSNLRHVAAMGG